MIENDMKLTSVFLSVFLSVFHHHHGALISGSGGRNVYQTAINLKDSVGFFPFLLLLIVWCPRISPWTGFVDFGRDALIQSQSTWSDSDFYYVMLISLYVCVCVSDARSDPCRGGRARRIVSETSLKVVFWRWRNNWTCISNEGNLKWIQPARSVFLSGWMSKKSSFSCHLSVEPINSMETARWK